MRMKLQIATEILGISFLNFQIFKLCFFFDFVMRRALRQIGRRAEIKNYKIRNVGKNILNDFIWYVHEWSVLPKT